MSDFLDYFGFFDEEEGLRKEFIKDNFCSFDKDPLTEEHALNSDEDEYDNWP